MVSALRCEILIGQRQVLLITPPAHVMFIFMYSQLECQRIWEILWLEKCIGSYDIHSRLIRRLCLQPSDLQWCFGQCVTLHIVFIPIQCNALVWPNSVYFRLFCNLKKKYWILESIVNIAWLYTTSNKGMISIQYFELKDWIAHEWNGQFFYGVFVDIRLLQWRDFSGILATCPTSAEHPSRWAKGRKNVC